MPLILMMLISLSAFSQTPQLEVDSLSRFSCIQKDTQQKVHFYFAPRIGFDPQQITSPLICHDVAQYGSHDSYELPRLEQFTGAIHGWPALNPLFYDNNGNGNMDVNDAIIKRTIRFGGSLPSNSNFFNQLHLPGNYTHSGAMKNSGLFILKPLINSKTQKSYCPQAKSYRSPLMRAISGVLKVSTEGLYVGKSPEKIMVDSEGNLLTTAADYILLNETNIKSVWFYLKNGVATQVNDNNIHKVGVYFFYPLDKKDPFVKKSHQKMYKVMNSAEVAGSEIYPTHDLKIGCIPTI